MFNTTNLRDAVYDWSLNLMEEGKELEAIFLLLSTWNFAYMRYSMTDFDLDEFKDTLYSCDFAYFESKKFENTDLEDETNKQKIMETYRKLSDLKPIRYVGATKIMHLECPSFFLMWDTDVRNHYGVGTSPEDYYLFMKKNQEKYRQGEFGDLEKDVTVPRAIDIYNIRKYSD